MLAHWVFYRPTFNKKKQIGYIKYLIFFFQSTYPSYLFLVIQKSLVVQQVIDLLSGFGPLVDGHEQNLVRSKQKNSSGNHRQSDGDAHDTLMHFVQHSVHESGHNTFHRGFVKNIKRYDQQYCRNLLFVGFLNTLKKNRNKSACAGLSNKYEISRNR